ncbi:MAG: hypothetical protein CM15mP107_3450 [Bacteroidota bacterium]|nr:MAG: hypothetical protein CM15mP107_3450 [Bacteroidota bacterium]
MLTVTNDVGCWEEETGEIEVYEVVADFTMSDTLLHCSPQDVTLISLNNDNIESWNWTIDEQEHSQTISDTDPVYIHNFDSTGYYSINLNLFSIHGCNANLDTIFILDQINPIIEDVAPDSICFQGNSVLEKRFKINFNSTFNSPLLINNYSWSISPDVPVVEVSDSTITFLFTESNVYSLSYSLELINGESLCLFNHDKTIEIGVDSDISIPDIICVGEPFEASADVSISTFENSFFEWSSTSGLTFSEINSLSTDISVLFDSTYTYTDSILSDNTWLMTDSVLNPTVPGNELMWYDISFYASNDNGCWQIINDSIKVYEVNGQIDLPIGIPGDQCAGYILNLETMYDNFISTYEWSHTEFNKITEESFTEIYSQYTDSVMSDQFFYPSIHDFSLKVQSIHGCSDTVLLDSLLDVVQPQPRFYSSSNQICDGESIYLVDSSTFMSEVPSLFSMDQYVPFYGYDSIIVNYEIVVDSTYFNIDSIINNTDSVIIDFDSQLWIMSDILISNPQYDSIINSIDSLLYINDSISVDTFKIRDTLLFNQYDLTGYYNNSFGDTTNLTFNFPYNSDVLIGTDSTEYDYEITMIASAF